MIITKEFMIENCGCYSQEKLMQCSFMRNGEITLKSIFESEIPIRDKYWFFCKKIATKEQNQQIAIDVADMVLPIYEKRHPNDKRVRECIEAAKSFIAGHIGLDELLTKQRAAYAAAAYAYAAAAYAAAAYAYAAADAAYADAYAAAAYAYAAADAAAAYAADAAAAAYAAYADAYDAAAYADAADAAAIKQQLQDYLMNYC